MRGHEGEGNNLISNEDRKVYAMKDGGVDGNIKEGKEKYGMKDEEHGES